MKASPGARRGDEGSVVVEFVLVSVLVVVLATAVLQLALTLHVRNTLTSCAAEGAHLAAHNDREVAEGVQRTDDLIAASLGGYDHETSARMVSEGGDQVVEVTVSAPVPVLGLWGLGSMTVRAHAVEEVDRDGPA